MFFLLDILRGNGMNTKKKKIILEDGSQYDGTAFGADRETMAELVFNTSPVGYQELFSDLSYTGQMVVMTYPLIGNYGICEDDYESAVPKMSALIVREYCDEPSNFRCIDTLGNVMKKYGIVGVAGVDTRKLARHIRDHGSCRAYIVDEDRNVDEALEELRAWIPDCGQVSRVSTPTICEYDRSQDGTVQNAAPNGPGDPKYPEYPKYPGYRIIVVDCGVKQNILRCLADKGCHVTVVPWDTPAEKIMELAPDGVLISNGPGNPEDVQPTIQTVRELRGRVPIFGICLGHQILSLAYGARTYKLKFGHRGGNHPVMDIKTGKVEITSQNHSYAVDADSLENTGLSVTHKNLLDSTVEGVECIENRVMSVQYHPEAAPGPADGGYLFERFLTIVNENKKMQGINRAALTERG